MGRFTQFMYLIVLFLLKIKCSLCESETQKITGNCGGTFSGYQYTINSPDYPSKYPGNQDCVYFLRGSRLARCDQEFHIQFLDLDLRPSENCEKDYLQIGERNIYCGSTVGLRIFKGENNVLKIRFHSGETGGGKGFRILVTTLPCVNSQGNKQNSTIRDVTPRTLKPETSTKLFYEGKIEKKNQKTSFDQEPQRENSDTNKFEVETLNPVYRPQVTFPENDIQPQRGDQPSATKPQNCSTPQDTRKLGSSTYLFLPPSSNPTKLFKLKNSNFSIIPPSREFALPVLETTPFRPVQENLKKPSFPTPFRSNQLNLNKSTFGRQESLSDFYGEPGNKVGVGVGTDCDKNNNDHVEFDQDENLPDRNFQGNLGDYPNLGNGVGYPGQIGGSGIVGHPLPGIGSGNYPGNNAGINPGINPGISPGLNPGINSGISPGLNPGYLPGINPGLNPGAGSVYPGISPGINSGINPGISPGLNPGYLPGINPGLNPGAGSVYPGQTPGINSGINPGIPGDNYPGQIGEGGLVGHPLPGIGSGNYPLIGVGQIPGINPGINPGLNPGIGSSYPGQSGDGVVIGNPLFPEVGNGINSGSYPVLPWANPAGGSGYNPGQIPTFPNPNYPILPNNAPNYPQFPSRSECCAPFPPAPRSLISTPGFPTLHFSATPYNCLYTVTKFSPSVCRLRLNLKFFNLGTDDPYCTGGHLEVGNSRICGCKTGQSLIVPFANDLAKIMNLRYSGFPNSKFGGFLIEVVQEVCGDYYPLIRNRKDLSAQNKSSSSPEERNESIVSSKSIISLEDPGSRTRWKREGYSYPKPTGHAILDAHSSGGRSESLFWNSCQARVFLDWILAAKEAFIRGSRCPGSGSSGINPVIPIPGGSGTFPGICEEIAAVEGVISSPFYPGYYPNNVRKCYRFYKSRGFCRLELSILDFDLEASVGCSKDYLLFSGQNKRYCGNSLTGTTTVFDISRSTAAEIFLVTDSSGSGRGFMAGFVQTLC